MSINPVYFSYLNHFGKTVTVRELVDNPITPNMIALRHDVDHDLDLALEMSYWESQRGIRSTYYLLHSAGYWEDTHLVEKCLQFQDFGHEVGLHLNVLSEWINGRVDDLSLSLEELIYPMREAGVHLSGVSTHGDVLCYEKQFINYWCFSELRPSDPVTVESGLCAEGIPAKEEKSQICYPSSHKLIRKDKDIFELWSISMKKLGIVYDAIHVPYDFYYTDSRGGWYYSEDPMRHSLDSGRYQILMHPVHWRGPQKIYFFLSTARSGSKWLTNLLDKATPLRACHEFSLNHRFKDGELIEEKRTAEGFTELVRKKEEVKNLLIEARTWLEEFPEDYAEANVYLERFLSVMEEIFPDATLVHLHRDPKDVIHSIINRDWYDTPEDNRHPIMEVENWDNLGQFEKSCWYVRRTNELLISSCQHCLSFEKMVKDFNYLIEKLRSLGIPVFPRLAVREYDKMINANYNYEFPEYEKWSLELKTLYHSICDSINSALEYEFQHGMAHDYKTFKSVQLKRRDFLRENPPKVISKIDFAGRKYNSYSSKGCRVKDIADGIEIFPKGGRTAHFLIGGGQWYKLPKKDKFGWEPKIAHYYRGVLDAEINVDDSAQLFCLMYDKNGKLFAKRSLGKIIQKAVPFRFSFKVKINATRFNIAIYMPLHNLPDKIKLNTFCLEMMPLQSPLLQAG